MSFFSRAFALFRTFPTVSAGAQLNPIEVADSIALTHTAIQPAEKGDQFRAFAIVGAAGAATLTLAEVPEPLTEYFLCAHAFHDDPVARVLRWLVTEINTGIAIHIQASDIDTPVAAIGTNVSYPLRRASFDGWVPRGKALAVTATGLAAAQVVAIAGIVAVIDEGEPPPPRF